MFYAPELADEDAAIEEVLSRDYPPPVPTYGDLLRGLFWLSPLGSWFAPLQARLMRKAWDRHHELCKTGQREGSKQR